MTVGEKLVTLKVFQSTMISLGFPVHLHRKGTILCDHYTPRLSRKYRKDSCYRDLLQYMLTSNITTNVFLPEDENVYFLFICNFYCSAAFRPWSPCVTFMAPCTKADCLEVFRSLLDFGRFVLVS